MPTTFNPDQFLGASYTEHTDTRGLLCPEGDWKAQIAKLTPRFNQGKEKDRTILDVQFEILDADAKLQAGAEGDSKLFCRYSVFLDLHPNGTIDMGKGKNPGLGRLREAVGQNADGKPWSPNMLMGQMAVIKVAHRPNPESDDPEDKFADVKGVSEL